MEMKKKIASLILAFGAISGAFMGGQVTAAPASVIEYEYYSDAAKTDWVGSSGMTCGGTRWTWGVKTQYYHSLTTSCL